MIIKKYKKLTLESEYIGDNCLSFNFCCMCNIVLSTYIIETKKNKNATSVIFC